MGKSTPWHFLYRILATLLPFYITQDVIFAAMSASFVLKAAALSENPQLIQHFGPALRKSWLLPEGIWHLRVLKGLVEGVFVPYEEIDFKNQSKASDPKQLLSWKTWIGKAPLSVLVIPAGDKRLVFRLDGADAEKTDAILAELRRRKASVLRELHLPFCAPTDHDEKNKLDWLRKEEAITDEEYRQLIGKLSA
jgi:hypothetical protein